MNYSCFNKVIIICVCLLFGKRIFPPNDCAYSPDVLGYFLWRIFSLIGRGSEVSNGWQFERPLLPYHKIPLASSDLPDWEPDLDYHYKTKGIAVSISPIHHAHLHYPSLHTEPNQIWPLLHQNPRVPSVQGQFCSYPLSVFWLESSIK
jgi:hypothetical protein